MPFMPFGVAWDDNSVGEYVLRLFPHFAFLSQDIPASKRQKTSHSQTFYSQLHPRPPIRWCDWQGSPTTIVGPRTSPVMVSNGQALASAKDTIFRDPSSFVPAEFHTHYPECCAITPEGQADEILSFIKHGVDVWSFIQHFKGSFAGRHYDSPTPPSREFPNSPSCEDFKDFVSATIRERVRTGSLIFWGFVGHLPPPPPPQFSNAYHSGTK